MASVPQNSANNLNTDIKVISTAKNRALVLALMLGLFGAILNTFPIELAYNISLLIGNLSFIIAAAYLRPALTLLCALICVAPLLVIWGHPFGFLTFGLEAIFVSYLRGRGWYLPTADFLYWLVIGMPITALLIWLNNPETQGIFVFSLLKQAINAIFYTSLAVITLFFISTKLNLRIRSQQPRLVKNLKQYLHYILWIMSAFFVVTVFLFLSRSLNQVQEQQFADKLDISSQYLASIIDNYVDEHKSAIAQLANRLSYLDAAQYHDALSQVHQLYPGFLTMLIANKEANIVSASPRSLIDRLPQSALSIADRPYFIQAFYHQSLYTSGVFLGRGFGADPIIAISAPIYESMNDKPIGIVEGSLNLNLFEQVNRYAAQDRQIDVVLTDENDNVIYGESSLALTPLAQFNFSLATGQDQDELMTIGTDDRQKQRYLYRKVVLSNQWKLYVLIEHEQVLQLIEQQYLTIFMALTIIFMLVIILANQLANTLNKPLAFALKELASGRENSGYRAIPYDAPSEFLSLYDELKQSKRKLLKQQVILEKQVEERTKALNDANKTLQELASKDSLTGLYNRRHMTTKFSELQAILARNNANMLVAMLDLDHFKQLNDQHGHLIGDQCLVAVGKTMQAMFDRRSDIVARFGGEEFIIVAQNDGQGQLLDKLEALREAIACLTIETDSPKEINLSISIGAIITKASYSNNIDDWLVLADQQLYRAKANGRNQLASHQLTNES
ncbi:diguanylate cyclase (GGDEF) domain-containing protein [Colwellia chukchiensis]|uniref:diguanylate cyclase n=1 Tax=Colwellia chukchiensis TaxID=641665 RepID=A0A1H7LII0_9GAMM|nr:diguanylate cyclase [Colwellia chukchiensis]SEK98792.1 diguanylate cyclase (GGDEF) domain-containing protein [Colwellia chukchiensis]